MSRTIQYLRAAQITVYLAVMALLIACSDSSDSVSPTRPVATVAVTPAASALVVGQTAELAAVAKDASGKVIGGRAVQWATSNASVATVSTAGVVTAVAEGTATVSATVEGKVGQTQIAVSRVPVASVRLTPLTVLLERGNTRQLTAVALDAAGNVLEGRAVEWTTDAPAIATVSASGLVQAIAPGYAGIRAAVEGKSATAAVTVPTPEPDGQFDLVYERRAFNQLGEIWRLSPTTGASTTLPLVVTIPGAYVRSATPSPDGTRVAFTVAWYPEGDSQMDGDIYVATIDGTNLRRLTTAEGMDDHPAWSPDGTRIAFTSWRSGHGDIWVMGANGTGQTNLTNDFLPATSNEHSPAWSPDGSRIVYSSDIDNFAYVKLWTMRPDGSDKRRVIPATSGTDVIDMEASWSPDGSKLAFRRISSGDSDIMIVTLGTQAVTRLHMDGVQTYPSWSPDGKVIAFSSSHQNPMSDIYTMKPDGTGLVRLTSGEGSHWRPRWLPAAGASVVAR
jgi:Tol biopolymer transport system component